MRSVLFLAALLFGCAAKAQAIDPAKTPPVTAKALTAGRMSLPSIPAAGGIVDLFTKPPDNGVYASGAGADWSYCPWTGCPGYDIIRAQHYIRFRSRAGYEVGETAAAIDAYLNTGYASEWQRGRPYSAGEQVYVGGNLYQAVSSGVSASSGAGPSGRGANIADGSVTWKWVIESGKAGNNKVGLSETYVIGPNAGQSWGGARNVIMLPGTRAPHVSNTELDFGNFSGACNGVNANCFGLFRYGNTRYPITAWDVFSTPEQTPEIGQPPDWAPSTAYTIPAGGAPVRKNGGRYYVLVQPGTSAASGGPTGTGAGIVDGTARWDYYEADFTGNVTGGSSYYGILFQGRNNIIRDVINIATWSQYGLRGDAGAKFTNSFIADDSMAPTSLRTGGTYSYATWNDVATTPFAIRLEGAYSGAALKAGDALIGRWSSDPSYSAISFNNTTVVGALAGFWGKASDASLYGNVPTGGAYRLRVGNTDALTIGASSATLAGTLTVTNRLTMPNLPASGSGGGPVCADANGTLYRC